MKCCSGPGKRPISPSMGLIPPGQHHAPPRDLKQTTDTVAQKTTSTQSQKTTGPSINHVVTGTEEKKTDLADRAAKLMARFVMLAKEPITTQTTKPRAVPVIRSTNHIQANKKPTDPKPPLTTLLNAPTNDDTKPTHPATDIDFTIRGEHENSPHRHNHHQQPSLTNPQKLDILCAIGKEAKMAGHNGFRDSISKVSGKNCSPRNSAAAAA